MTFVDYIYLYTYNILFYFYGIIIPEYHIGLESFSLDVP